MKPMIPTQKKQLFTTGQVAKICGVNIRTVNRWSDQGYIRAIHLPGRGDRRIELEELIRFLKENGMDVPEALNEEKFSKKRVLIVDNEEPVTRAIERVLRPLGVEVEIALDGFKAGYLLKEFQPDLVTLDLKMPGCDGFEVLSMIRSLEVSPKVLIVSGQEKSELQKAVQAGADQALEKPFSNEQLAQWVKKLLGKE